MSTYYSVKLKKDVENIVSTFETLKNQNDRTQTGHFIQLSCDHTDTLTGEPKVKLEKLIENSGFFEKPE